MLVELGREDTGFGCGKEGGGGTATSLICSQETSVLFLPLSSFGQVIFLLWVLGNQRTVARSNTVGVARYRPTR